MVAPRQGEIWWMESPKERRPVLVVTRSAATEVLNRIVIAPITSTIRGIPTEIRLGAENGLRDGCVATFDNVAPVRRSYLTDRVGALRPEQANEICRALAALAEC